MKIKNIEKAAERIKKAVQNKERLILYGDGDLDGIASAVMLEETIKNIGGRVEGVFFPDREKNGYGLNQQALNFLKEFSPALIVTLDLGIANIKEVELANKLGFEVLIIDHHETLNGLPLASIIVDPKQPSDLYPFKGLANAGVTYNLCLEILGKNISENLNNSFLELAALATIADMVPQVEQNLEIIEKGLRSLSNSFRPAFQAFFEVLGKGSVFEKNLTKIISALNLGQSIDFKNESYLLLSCCSLQECRELVKKLLEKEAIKEKEIKEMIEEVERRIAGKIDSLEIIFEGDPNWKLIFAGTVAAILCNKYNKPVFLYKKMEKESCGSVRVPPHINSVEAMKSCSNLLLTYGGHAQASGFRIKNENLEKFKICLVNFFEEKE